MANQKDIVEIMKHYPPLSKKEEREMINENKNDRKKLNELLILHNVGLVFRLIKKYQLKNEDIISELISNFIECLVEKVDSFDINRNIKFSTYILSEALNYVSFGREYPSNYLCENKVAANSISMDMITSIDKESGERESFGYNGNNFVYDKIIDNTFYSKFNQNRVSEDFHDKDCHNIIKACSSYLNSFPLTILGESAKKVFYYKYVENLSNEDVLNKVGISKTRYHVLIAKDLKLLKPFLVNKLHIKSMSDFNFDY